MTRVVVAMSGGVDSSVAAARLVQAGYDVVGLSMQLYDQRASPEAFGSCCSLDDLYDARRVADQLGFPHYIVNFEERFRAKVVAPFVAEYAAGRTPIPCVNCNADLKFSTLVERAAGLDAAWVATGHYARVRFDDASRRYRLLRGADPDKDQSYFLFSLTQEQLARALFPIGEMPKAEVRAEAARLGLSVADKPDSHEICFVPDGRTADFVERELASRDDRELASRDDRERRGPILDREGAVVGEHGGVHRFTVGQRKGLGLATGVPMYVLRMDAARREVVVGPREALGGSSLRASTVNWVAGEAPAGPRRLTARIRHRHTDAPATVTAIGEARAEVTFDEPQMAITPGQAVVWYDGEDVVGGGWID